MASRDAYAPFERHDRYGKMGMAPQSMLERLRLGLSAVIILPVRALGTLSCVVGFFAACKLLQLLPSHHRSPPWQPWARPTARHACCALGSGVSVGEGGPCRLGQSPSSCSACGCHRLEPLQLGRHPGPHVALVP